MLFTRGKKNPNVWRSNKTDLSTLLEISMMSICVCVSLGRVVQSLVKITQGQCEIWIKIWKLKSISVLILFVHKLMIGSSKNKRENYPRKCFWTEEKKPELNLTPGWALTGLRTAGPCRITCVAVAMYEVLFRENVDRRGKRTCQVFPFQTICQGYCPMLCLRSDPYMRSSGRPRKP